MRYAGIVGSRIIDIREGEKPVYGPTPDGDEVISVEIPDEVDYGWTYEGGAFIPPREAPVVYEDTMTEQEQRELEMAANIDYAVQLLELNMEV